DGSRHKLFKSIGVDRADLRVGALLVSSLGGDPLHDRLYQLARSLVDRPRLSKMPQGFIEHARSVRAQAHFGQLLFLLPSAASPTTFRWSWRLRGGSVLLIVLRGHLPGVLGSLAALLLFRHLTRGLHPCLQAALERRQVLARQRPSRGLHCAHDG